MQKETRGSRSLKERYYEMAITLRAGCGNEIQRPSSSLASTDDIGPAIFAALGVSPDNTEIILNGQVYSGPLSDGDVVILRQRANSKGVSLC